MYIFLLTLLNWTTFNLDFSFKSAEILQITPFREEIKLDLKHLVVYFFLLKNSNSKEKKSYFWVRLQVYHHTNFIKRTKHLIIKLFVKLVDFNLSQMLKCCFFEWVIVLFLHFVFNLRAIQYYWMIKEHRFTKYLLHFTLKPHL